MITGEQRISHEIGIECGLELGSQVPGGDPDQDCPAFFGQPRVASSATPTALLHDVHNGHGSHSASEWPWNEKGAQENSQELPAQRLEATDDYGMT